MYVPMESAWDSREPVEMAPRELRPSLQNPKQPSHKMASSLNLASQSLSGRCLVNSVKPPKPVRDTETSRGRFMIGQQSAIFGVKLQCCPELFKGYFNDASAPKTVIPSPKAKPLSTTWRTTHSSDLRDKRKRKPSPRSEQGAIPPSPKSRPRTAPSIGGALDPAKLTQVKRTRSSILRTALTLEDDFSTSLANLYWSTPAAPASGERRVRALTKVSMNLSNRFGGNKGLGIGARFNEEPDGPGPGEYEVAMLHSFSADGKQLPRLPCSKFRTEPVYSSLLRTKKPMITNTSGAPGPGHYSLPGHFDTLHKPQIIRVSLGSKGSLRHRYR